MTLQREGLEIDLRLEPWNWRSDDAEPDETRARWNYTVKRKDEVLAHGQAYTYMDARSRAEEAVKQHAADEPEAETEVTEEAVVLA